MIEVSAPGKLYIAGEYAVVEPGHPAIIVAVDQFITVTIEAAVKNVSGVDKDSVKVMFNASKAKVNFNDSTNIEVIEKAIQTMGYSVIKSSVRAA